MLEADYLIVGSGAVGMAFADVLLTETDSSVIIVDRYAKPGGHWNVAYPFVTLHQPSLYYGVSSLELNKGRKDEVGLNKGLHELASGPEILAYFQDVMLHQFLPSGRVQYFPMCEYKGDNTFVSLITGEESKVEINKKLVDATYLNTSVPSTHTPSFTVEEGVPFMPLNDLPTVSTPPAGFVVIGGGKTGIDACLWLLEQKVDPDKISWIVSRDAWLLNRQNVQPTEEFFESSMGAQAAQMEAAAQATSIDDMYDRLEASGVVLRLDKNVRPKMFHGATVSKLELAQLQRIKNIVRKGRVQRITPKEIILDQGSIPTSPDHIHVDCSASAIKNLEIKPVFTGNVITPQTVRPYQPIFSAAFVAHIEATFTDEKKKNEICGVVPLPNHDTDWVRMMDSMMENQMAWSKHREIRKWLYNNRLDGFSKLVRDTPKDDEAKQSILKRLRKNSLPALMNLQKFIKELDGPQNVPLERPQFQIRKNLFFKGRLSETPEEELALGEGELLVKVDKFAFTANNITYAVAGDQLGYWKFFPALGQQTEGWGVLPVWGFADVVESQVEEIPVGDRLFGYFPPASHVKMKPSKISAGQFVENSAHRSKLPQGYNFYTRVKADPNYNPATDNGRALFSPLFLTSFCIWDSLQDKGWHGAEQILVLSASSKTSIGLGYALKDDPNAPKVIGITSSRNIDVVNGLALYDEVYSYDTISKLDASIPTVIVDMSGNAKILAQLHQNFGDNMRYTINVGVTHWAHAKPPKGMFAERSEFFFAPAHIQKRIKDWGFAGFNQKTTEFMMKSIAKTGAWLTYRKVDGLKGMAEIHEAVCNGQIPANEGLIVEL